MQWKTRIATRRKPLPTAPENALQTGMSLSSDEIERYSRHLLLSDIGGPGQAKLKAARVLAIGAGGLGAPLLQYLSTAGVGTIGIVDDDHVDLSNLQRQVIHGTPDIGRPKVESAADAIRRLNPHVAVVTHALRLTEENARELVRGYDVIAEGSDNFATRYAVSDACFHEKKPLVTAALGQFDGTLTTLRPFESRADGRPNPTYRCLFPDPPAPGAIPTCAEAGVLGALAGVMGSLMAMEVIREITGFGEGMVGRLLMVDARSMRFDVMRYRWDDANSLNGTQRPIGP
jgi:molybdopterin/thiamine biosynthesis adenylyltransferase